MLPQKKAAVVVGLTGQTGAGKSTVSGYFAASGYSVIDADLVAREVVLPGSPCLKELSGIFGGDILKKDGSLDRPKLGGLVFSHPEQLAKLNQTIFPYITKRIQEKIQTLLEQGQTLILLDAPTLFEAGADVFCDYVVSVTAPAPLRLQRILARDNLSQDQAKARISAQNDEAFYRNRSSYVIENTGSLEALAQQAQGIAQMIREVSERASETCE